MFLKMRRYMSNILFIPLNNKELFCGNVFDTIYNHTNINYRYEKKLPFQFLPNLFEK